MAKKTPPTIKVVDEPLLVFIRRLMRTGLYGTRETEVLWKLLRDQVDYLLESGKLERLEQHLVQSKEKERFAAANDGKKAG